MNNLYEALEICLQEIEQGADVETVLFRYPDLADELRPILEISAGAKSMAVPAPSAEVVRRNRAKVLQHAAQMHEGKVRSSRRIWFASLRRIAVTLAVVTILFVSGTSLVGASSNTIPGDNLYPVKRTWEGLRLLFTFNAQVRDTLEVEHENERLHELRELIAEGRSEEVDFNGVVEVQNGNEWMVTGVRVLITDQTELRDQMIVVGNAVRVRGVTQPDGTILAQRIRLLSSDDKLPDTEDEHESDHGNDSGSVTGEDKPRFEETQTPESESESENSNSGSSNDSVTNENLNDNGSDDSHSSENINSNDSSGSDDNGNDSSGGDSHNDNSNDSGGGDNSGSGSDSSGGGGGDE